MSRYKGGSGEAMPTRRALQESKNLKGSLARRCWELLHAIGWISAFVGFRHQVHPSHVSHGDIEVRAHGPRTLAPLQLVRDQSQAKIVLSSGSLKAGITGKSRSCSTAHDRQGAS